MDRWLSPPGSKQKTMRQIRDTVEATHLFGSKIAPNLRAFHPITRVGALRVVFILALLLTLSCEALGQQATVTLELMPEAFLDHHQAQLYITIESPQDLNNAVLQISPSPDFTAQPSMISLPSVTRNIIEHVTISLRDPRLLSGEQALAVTLTIPDGSGNRKVLVSKLLKFSYTPEIPLWVFFVFAVVGLIVGYWARLFVKLLGSTTPPSPAPPQETQASGPQQGQPGPLTRFVQKHYYLVDFCVTVILAFILLASLTTGGRPPQSGTTWYGALATGLGIGVFTNSELLTRLRR